MQTPALLEVMTRQIDSEVESRLAAARAEAAHIKEDARARAAKRREQLHADVSAEIAELKRRARGRAEAESEMVVLTTKDTVTDELLRRVQAELARVASSDEFGPVLEALLAELMQDAPKDGIVLVPPAHEARCKQWLDANGHHGFDVQGSRELTDGVAVQDKAHTFRITNTLTSRFERLEPDLRKYSVQELFGKEG